MIIFISTLLPVVEKAQPYFKGECLSNFYFALSDWLHSLLLIFWVIVSSVCKLKIKFLDFCEWIYLCAKLCKVVSLSFFFFFEHPLNKRIYFTERRSSLRIHQPKADESDACLKLIWLSQIDPKPLLPKCPVDPSVYKPGTAFDLSSSCLEGGCKVGHLPLHKHNEASCISGMYSKYVSFSENLSSLLGDSF